MGRETTGLDSLLTIHAQGRGIHGERNQPLPLSCRLDSLLTIHAQGRGIHGERNQTRQPANDPRHKAVGFMGRETTDLESLLTIHGTRRGIPEARCFNAPGNLGKPGDRPLRLQHSGCRATWHAIGRKTVSKMEEAARRLAVAVS